MEELNTNQEAPNINPWEDRANIGFFRALWETMVSVISRPGAFFDDLKVQETIKDPYLFYYIFTVSTAILSIVVSMLIKPVQGAVVAFIASCIIIAIIASFALFIGAAILHLGVMMFGGTGGYKGTFYVLAYASATNVFSIIPFVGGLIGGIWGIVVGVKGFKRVHNLSTAKAILAYLGVFIIFFLIGLMAAIAIPNLFRARTTANLAAARATVSSISTALETYALENNGKYPTSEYDLVYKKPSYLSQTYDKKQVSGYIYSLDLKEDGYEITAKPASCNTTGTKVLTFKKGGKISESYCK